MASAARRPSEIGGDSAHELSWAAAWCGRGSAL